MEKQNTKESCRFVGRFKYLIGSFVRKMNQKKKNTTTFII